PSKRRQNSLYRYLLAYAYMQLVSSWLTCASRLNPISRLQKNTRLAPGSGVRADIPLVPASRRDAYLSYHLQGSMDSLNYGYKCGSSLGVILQWVLQPDSALSIANIPSKRFSSNN
ncbi:hypothetical protein BGX38DRAFT_1200808, partial [Terfezia claveryi]